MGSEALQIGEVARKTGISIDTIRFYEKAGLLPPPARTKGGYRVYHQRELADLEFIRRAQDLGFALKEIHELFSIQRHPHEACQHVQDLISQKLAVVRGKIQQLQTLESGLVEAFKKCRKATGQSVKHPDCCPVLDQFADIRTTRRRNES
jgi:MerR family mercuric resistance operon transcriptional regulator